MKSYEAEKTEDLTNVIFLDIETWAGDKPSLEDIVPDARLKDPDKIRADKEAKRDKVWRAQALSPIKGQVFCIGMAVDDEPSFAIVGADEQEVLEMLDIELAAYSFPKIVGHNLYDFDALFLYYKGLKYRMKNVVNAFSDKTNLIDTMVLLNGTSWKTMTSLDNMAKLLLGRSAKDDITGKDVHDLILAKQGDRVLEYCKNDVKILRDCYRVLNSMGIYQ